MPYLHNYRLFISHAWEYSERYTRVVSMLNEASNFKWSNFSVPYDGAFPRMNKSQLQEEIRQQIRPVDCVIIMSGMYINHSDWILFEMEFARTLGKPIVGIRRRGAQQTPKVVQDYSSRLVPQMTSSIIAAIRELIP
ncbi:MAG: TIR domain-containing protein [Alphaproteobacteria bacterium]|nr:MAG: TIR domain-containing protein [Alphaproteobacteria bacterium]